MDFKHFCQVAIVPSYGSSLMDVLKEMKSLSEFVGLPVCAVYNNKKLCITPTADIDVIARCYLHDIECNYIRKL